MRADRQLAELIFILLLSGSCWAAELTGTVTRVIDGDTIVVESATGPEKIRLAEIDAPESKQAHGKLAADYLAGLILNRQVTIQYSKRGRYGRLIGTVMLNGQNINSQMINTGHAWHYKKYSKSPALASLESTARANGLGLWSGDNPLAPWTFRKR